MKKYLLLVTLLLVLSLSACGNKNYTILDYEINGYSVYEKVESGVFCSRISQFGVFFESDDEYYLGPPFGNGCQDTLFVIDNNEYITLTMALERDVFTKEDILSVDWDFEIYENFPLNDYGDLTKLVFEYTNSETVEFDDPAELARLLENSDSVFQHMIIGYSYSNSSIKGSIKWYNNDELIVEFDVYEYGICDTELNACVDDSGSNELYAVYQSQSGN